MRMSKWSTEHLTEHEVELVTLPRHRDHRDIKMRVSELASGYDAMIARYLVFRAPSTGRLLDNDTSTSLRQIERTICCSQEIKRC